MPRSSIYNHVSPGVYSREIIDLTVNEEKDDGLTSLGVVGETENGKAFIPTRISKWDEFTEKFGNTNPEIFEESKYPRYELPYIAKTYSQQSNNMKVTRVLGMSGYNAGPAWVITAHRTLETSGDKMEETKYDNMVVAVLRSRAYYTDYERYASEYYEDSGTTSQMCDCGHTAAYDKIRFNVGELSLKPECLYVTHYNPSAITLSAYHSTSNFGDECETYIGGTDEESFEVDYTNHGRFSINGFTGIGDGSSGRFSYSVTLNPADSNYILKVLGTDPMNGKAPIYVESLYDNALNEGIENGTIKEINSKLVFYDVCYTADLVSVPPVDGLVEKGEGALRKSDIGKRLLYSKNANDNDLYFYDFIADGDKYIVIKKQGTKMEDGNIYKVLSFVDKGKLRIVYGKVHKKNGDLVYNKTTDEYTEGFDEDSYDNLVEVPNGTWSEESEEGQTLKDEIYKGEGGLNIISDIDKNGNIFNNTVAVKNKKDGKYYVLTQDHYELQKSTGMVLDNIMWPGTLRYPTTLYGKVKYPNLVRRFYGSDGKVKKTEFINVHDEPSDYLVNVTVYDTNGTVKPGPSTSNSGKTYNGIIVPNSFLSHPDIINRLKNPNSTVISAKTNSTYPIYSASTVLVGKTMDILNYKCSGKTYNVDVCTEIAPTPNVPIAASGSSANGYTVGKLSPDKIATATPLVGWTVVINTKSISPEADVNYADEKTTGTPKFDYYFNFGTNSGGLVNLHETYSTAIYKDMYFYDKVNGTYPVTCDLNNYKEPYRNAMTPWLVSNVKGDSMNMALNKLFRFHTVKDGVDTTNLVKVSIADISVDDCTFTVYVRDINDTDSNPRILESYTKCNLSPNSPDYIAYRIGTSDGLFASKSNYITVEMKDGIDVSNAVPCGFIGYPTEHFEGVPFVYGSVFNPYRNWDVTEGFVNGLITTPNLKYNTIYDTSISNRKQYFGLSDLEGIDYDLFKYKGCSSYDDKQETLTKGFHLDCRLNETSYSGDEFESITITVDGEVGYSFDTVDITNQSNIYYDMPIIDTEENMINNIYVNKNLRKFTVYFYGGFDGWDEHRGYRSTLDRFKTCNYKGYYNKFVGEGFSFGKIWNSKALDLPSDSITSDWYAFLRGARQYSNPESISINVFATPGFDCINSTTLSDSVIDMIEEERGDSLYVMTLPDKPFGANDGKNEMYIPSMISDYLYDTGLDSNYTCVYYPWVKFDDTEHSQYIYLPPTKDVVRNIAISDNTSSAWLSPAGKNRGDVECIEPRLKTTLEDEDILYEGRINPIKTFAYEGSYIWGQKNLQIEENILNRISIRRLLNHIKRNLAVACRSIIFELNDANTKSSLSEAIIGVMGDVQANRGITDYRYEIDENANGDEIPCKIWLRPIATLEYIPIDLILTQNGINFK